MSELISKDAIIGITDRETLTTKPSNFTANEKFIQYMKDPNISSFGHWQFNNGYNTALVTVDVEIKKLPTIEYIRAHWVINSDGYYPYCSNCKAEPENGKTTKFCPECGAKMDEVNE